MSGKLSNRIAVVTGAAGGIGSDLVLALVKEGVFCVMLDKHAEPSAKLLELLNQERGRYFSVDLTNIQEIDETVDKIYGEFGNIDFLYNVAGIGVYKKLENISVDEWNLSINLNLTAPFYLTKRLLPLMQKSDMSLIFNIGSGMGVYPSPGRSAYCASKFGLRGLTLSLAKEYKNKKTKFQLLTLGSVMTCFGTGGLEKRIDLQKNGKKYLTPESVAEKIVELTLDRESPDEIEFCPAGYEEENK